MALNLDRIIRRAINSINYRLIDPLTGRKAKEWASKTDFRKTHRRQFKLLSTYHSLDEAARLAVGGDFDAIGSVLRNAVVYHGLRPDDYLIDIGCGSGRLAKPLAGYLKGRYLGIDVVPELVDYARNIADRPDWRFKIADGLTIPEKDQTADMVCFFSVLTHLLHEESFVYLREAKRVLKPGGKIILSFLDFRVDGHWPIFETNLGDVGIGSKPMNVFISVDTLQAWARHLDLEVETIRDGDEPYLPLATPLKFANGTVAKERVAFGQSICVLLRK